MRVIVIFRGLDNQRQEAIARMVTVYPHKSGSAWPELVVHYDDKPQDNIDLKRIELITITER